MGNPFFEIGKMFLVFIVVKNQMCITLNDFIYIVYYEQKRTILNKNYMNCKMKIF